MVEIIQVTRRLVLAGVVGFWVAVGMLVQAARSEAAPVIIVRAPVIVSRPAPVAPLPPPLPHRHPVVHVPAPVVVSPSLANPPVRCERDGLGQCVGGEAK